jgi:hypothetical protein
MFTGQLLSLISDRNVVIERVLVSVENGVYFVCKSEEFDAAKNEGREPICIGFRREYVLEPKVVG